MEPLTSSLFMFCLIWVSVCSSGASSVNIGIIDDFDSRSGKEERVAMDIAAADFYGYSNLQPKLHYKNYGKSPVQAYSLEFVVMNVIMEINPWMPAKTLIEKMHVKALMGFQTWQAASVTVDLSNQSKTPLLSLAEEVPPWASREWPFLINAARSQRAQMKTVVAIVQSWLWRRVSIIYEDTGSTPDCIISHLINEFQDADVFIEQIAPLSPRLAFSDKHYTLGELESLKAKQSRVFIVHTSANLASNIFIQAKKLGMMENDSVWITTSTIANQLDSLSATTISSMQGVLGVKSYFQSSRNQFKRFKAKFRALFKTMYPNDPYREPGLYALQAYDALWALALAINPISNSSLMSGESLVDNVSKSNFKGLNGEFKLSKQGGLEAQKVFGIVNVVGMSYREVGYWSDGLGFSVSLTKESKYEKGLSSLVPVFWPGGPLSVPRGYTIPTDANPLKIGVPSNPAFDDFVKVDCDNSSCINPRVTGFSADVFAATLGHLRYNLSHVFVPYNGSYDTMIQQLQNQTFQAVIGDTSIIAKRYEYAQFTPPYSESGLQAVIYLQNHHIDKAWLFKTPFTASMWMFTGFVNIYNGFVVWLIERRHNTAFRGSIWNQIGTLINLAFTTLFSLHGGELHSNMSRMTMLVWLFVALVVTQSYTASLTSLLTFQKLGAQKLDIQELIRNKVQVGCDGNSFVGSYLQGMGFSKENILKVYSADEYPLLLKNGTIKAAFLITPYVKIFLAKYCRGYATAGPTFQVGGFGFGFSKGHPLLPDMSEAILYVSESGELRRLENKMLKKYNCSKSQSNDDSGEKGSLGINSFAGLFGITFGTSTVALVSFCVFRLRQNRQLKYCRLVTDQPQLAAGNHEPDKDETHMFAYEMETYKTWEAERSVV